MKWFLGLYAVASLVTFFAYAWDKRQARLHRPRISEHALHLLELFFGWPGALIAQNVFAHKRRKTRYMVWFWLIVAMHVTAWIAWMIHGVSE